MLKKIMFYTSVETLVTSARSPDQRHSVIVIVICRHLSSSVIITPCQSLLPIVFRQCKQVTKMLQKLVVE